MGNLQRLYQRTDFRKALYLNILLKLPVVEDYGLYCDVRNVDQKGEETAYENSQETFSVKWKMLHTKLLMLVR